MKLITNIQLENNYIIITYNDNTKKRLFYKESARLELLNYLKSMKNDYLKAKKYLKNSLIKTSIYAILENLILSIIFIYTNNIFLDIFLGILSFNLVLINYLFLITYKNDYQSILKILITIENNKLPEEDKYLENKKIININEYLLNKKNQNLFNYYDYDYPKENKNNIYNNECKILEFKRK